MIEAELINDSLHVFGVEIHQDSLEPDKIFSFGYGSNYVYVHFRKDSMFMQDEIFGPILPVIAFENLEDAIQKVKSKHKPLALYIYSKNRKTINKILHEISFGGGAINDSMMRLSNSNLPFGGVGFSGTGGYHGKAGFDNFSHFKGILDKPFWLELNFKSAPYSERKRKWIKWFVE